MKTYNMTQPGQQRKFSIDSKNLDTLRSKLIREYLWPHSGAINVYSSTGRYLGNITMGYNDILWHTPKGQFYTVHRDGKLGWKYQ